MTRRVAKAALIALVLAFPWLPTTGASLMSSANAAPRFALIAVSLVVLTGWVGQISLGHAGLVGVGAYVTGLVMGGLNIGFPVSMLWGGAAGMLVACLLGTVALRVRGLYLAVATLIFSWLAEAFLFRQDWFTKHSTVDVGALGEPNTIPYFDWASREVYYYAAWATVAAAILLLSNLRDSKTGRAFFAVRGSEVAAASLGIDVMRTKLVAFATSGFLAGVAGSLIMVSAGTVTPDAFKVDQSLFFLSIAVVGGLSSLGGSVAAGFVFALLELAFFEIAAFEGYLTVVSAALLAVVLLAYRGGLAAIPSSLAPRLAPIAGPLSAGLDTADRALARAADRVRSALFESDRDRDLSVDPIVRRGSSRVLALASTLTGGRIRPRPALVRTEPPLDIAHLGVGDEGPATRADGAADPSGGDTDVAEASAAASERGRAWAAATPPPLPPRREDRRVLLAARGVTVRFGGLTANEDVSLEVREGEIVGLIGPNGAGKTTCFNAIAGLNVPAEGRIELFGQDVTGLPVHERALLGVGRTFQAIQLFGQLSVFENLLVATHQHNPTGMLAHLVVTPRSLVAEAEARASVQRVLELLDLVDVADRPCRDLPFGVLRMVEVARALVTGARLVMLDEPASGLDNAETDRLIELVRFLRSLGVTVLLIEHDVRMVTAVCDHLYVLERGRILAEGPAADVVRDERVVAAYLGKPAGDEAEPAAAGARERAAAPEEVPVG